MLAVFTLAALLNTTFGMQGSDDSWKTNALLAAGAVGHAAVNLAAQYFGGNNEEPVNPVNETAESPIQAANPERIAPEEPFNRRYLPNGMTIDSPWRREITLPATDNNCALFGIFGVFTTRNNLTRETIIGHLIQIGGQESPLATEIRRLMAYDILLYLTDDLINLREYEQASLRSNRLATLTQGLPPVISNMLNQHLNHYLQDRSDQNRQQLLKLLQNKIIFQNYTHDVLGKRLGDSEEDPYPTLQYIPGPTPTDGMTGAIPAIAAMTGTTINIHQRHGREIVQVAGYVYRGAVATGAQPRTVDLIHTTADPIEAPHALNHFNLLERVRSISQLTNGQHRNLPEEPEDPLEYIKYFYTIDEDQAHATAIKYQKILTWGEKLWLNYIITESHGLMWELPCQQRKDQWTFNQNRPNKSIFFNLPYLNFLYLDEIDGDWSITIKHIVNFLTQINKAEEVATDMLLNQLDRNKKTYNRQKNRLKNNNDAFVDSLTDDVHDLNVTTRDNHENMLDLLNCISSWAPDYSKIQFLILIIDAFIRQKIKKYSTTIGYSWHTISPQNFENLKTMVNKYVKNITKREIIFWQYMLTQLIAFSRLHGIDPIVPHYNPPSREEQDRELMELLIFTDHRGSSQVTTLAPLEVTINEEITPPAPSKKKKKNRKKKKVTKPQGPSVISSEPEAQDEIIDEVIVSPSEVVSVEVSPDGNVIKEVEELEDETQDTEVFDQAAQDQYFAELRVKKKSELKKQKSQRTATATHTTLEDIGALLPNERTAFQVFLLANMRGDERAIYESFITAQNNALTLQEVDAFADFVTHYLEQFLRTQAHPNGARMYSDQAIASFIQSIKQGHEKSFHNFHAPKGKKVPGTWIKFRYGTWIEHGILNLEGANRTFQTAHAHYQLILTRRMGQ